MSKILLVDDDSTLRQIYSAYLDAEGYEVLSAANAEEALLHKGNAVDLILLDLRLPTAGGEELLPALQTQHPSAKIVISSCYTPELQRSMVGNAADYFDKSSGCKALVAKIKSLLS